MQPRLRLLAGTLTSVLWIVVGVYMVFKGVDETWRMVGYGVVVLGIARALLLVYQRNQARRGSDESSRPPRDD